MIKVLNDIQFKADADEVLRRAHLTDADEETRRSALALVAQAQHLARPKVVYRVCYVENKAADSLEIGGIRFTSRVLRANLNSVERVFAYVGTAGTELDQVTVPGGDMLLGYCLDTIKETALRAALTHLREYLSAKYALGRTARMNPGSLADWPIQQQRELFAVFGDVTELVGVRLTDSFLMIPAKSVSGIIFPTEVNFESCQLCPRETCPGRRAPYEAQLAAKYGISP